MGGQMPAALSRRCRQRYSMAEVTSTSHPSPPPGTTSSRRSHRLSMDITNTHTGLDVTLSGMRPGNPFLPVTLPSPLATGSPAVTASISTPLVSDLTTSMSASPCTTISTSSHLTNPLSTSTPPSTTITAAVKPNACDNQLLPVPVMVSSPLVPLSGTSHQRTLVRTTVSSSPATTQVVPMRASSIHQKYVALYVYRPQKEDELELRKSDIYYVNEMCQDGWYKGVCLRTGRTGVFPGNYVQLCKPSPPALPARPCTMTSRLAAHTPVPPPPTASTVSPSPTHVRTSSPVMGVSGRNAQARALPTLYPKNTSISRVTPPNVSLLSQQQIFTTACQSTPSSSKSDKKKEREKKERGRPSVEGGAATSSAISRVGNFVRRVAAGGSGRKKHGSKNTSPSSAASSSSPSSSSQTLVISNPRETRHTRSLSMPSNNCTTSAVGAAPPVSACRKSVVLSPADSQATSHHRTSSNLETAVEANSARPKQPQPLIRERFKCVVPYPPNSDYELELKVGDIVYVYRKRDDGWYKGTLQRTGKTGLFPGSFVERC